MCFHSLVSLFYSIKMFYYVITSSSIFIGFILVSVYRTLPVWFCMRAHAMCSSCARMPCDWAVPATFWWPLIDTTRRRCNRTSQWFSLKFMIDMLVLRAASQVGGVMVSGVCRCLPAYAHHHASSVYDFINFYLNIAPIYLFIHQINHTYHTPAHITLIVFMPPMFWYYLPVFNFEIFEMVQSLMRRWISSDIVI